MSDKIEYAGGLFMTDRERDRSLARDWLCGGHYSPGSVQQDTLFEEDFEEFEGWTGLVGWRVGEAESILNEVQQEDLASEKWKKETAEWLCERRSADDRRNGGLREGYLLISQQDADDYSDHTNLTEERARYALEVVLVDIQHCRL